MLLQTSYCTVSRFYTISRVYPTVYSTCTVRALVFGQVVSTFTLFTQYCLCIYDHFYPMDFERQYNV